MSEPHTHRWTHITDVPDDWEQLKVPSLHNQIKVWEELEKRLGTDDTHATCIRELRRRWAIETGAIERLYTLKEGATRTLIERGLDAALLCREDTDQDPDWVIAVIKDQLQAIEGMYQFVAGERRLTSSYVKELHAVVTHNQEYCDARNQFGTLVQVPLRRGEWKQLPNALEFEDGSTFEYCPPEHVASEMEQLLKWHYEHEARNVTPEVEAAWLHHRFSLIHPFQDGNGRLARCLATLVMIRARWFPLVVTRLDKVKYLLALRDADRGCLTSLVRLFASFQEKAIREAMSVSRDVKESRRERQAILDEVRSKLERQKEKLDEERSKVFKLAAVLQEEVGSELNRVEIEVESAVKSIDQSYNAFVDSASVGSGTPADNKALYHRYQVGQCAKRLEYFANLSAYSAWTRLGIDGVSRTELLFSFHGYGHDPRGILACSAVAYEKEKLNLGARTTDDTGDIERATNAVEITPMCDEPFVFTYLESPEDCIKRFRSWLEDCIRVGLELWNKRLG